MENQAKTNTEKKEVCFRTAFDKLVVGIEKIVTRKNESIWFLQWLGYEAY